MADLYRERQGQAFNYTSTERAMMFYKWSITAVAIPFEHMKTIGFKGAQYSNEYGVDIFLMPLDLSLFYDLDRYWSTNVYDKSDIYLFSPTPIETTKATIDVVSMDTSVYLLFLISTTAICLLWTFSEDLNGKVNDSRNVAVTIVILLLRNGWTFLMYPLKKSLFNNSKKNRQKCLLTSWMLFIFFFLNYLSSKIKSEFTISDYQKIDSLNELVNRKDTHAILIDNSQEMRLIKLLGMHDEGIRDLLARTEANNGLIEAFDFMSPDLYTDNILRKKGVLISIFNFVMLSLGNVIKIQMDDEVLKKGFIYKSAKALKSVSFVLCFTRPFSKDLKLRETFNQILANSLETTPLRYMDFEFLFPLRDFFWQIPIKEVKSINLKDFSAIFWFVLCGNSIALLFLLIEIMLSFV